MRKVKLILISVTILGGISVFISTRSAQYKSFLRNVVATPLAPIESVISGTGGWFERQFRFFAEMNNYKLENDQLKKKVYQLENNLRKFETYEQENSDLRKKLEFKQNYSQFEMVGAEIIAKDASNWTDYFLIDKGTKDGMKTNMVVLTEKGLVGVIVETAYNHAKVRTILCEENNVAAEAKKSRDFGIIKGDRVIAENSFTKMNYIDPQAKLIVGDDVMTSGLGGIYPRGIFIGKIQQVKKESYETTKYAIIKSNIDFRNLDKVLIIKQVWEPYQINQEN